MHPDQVSPKINHYYPGIDFLRAIAVLLVLFHHYINQKIAGYLAFGSLGVDIFFTISGFLITGILFSYKEKYSFGKSLKIFYTRRVLRIFPIYYLYLGIVILIFHDTISHDLILWTALFCENFYVISGRKTEWVLTHFWSLAVEEQFYLVWPFLVFIFSRKSTRFIILVIIISSFIFSLLMGLFSAVQPVAYMDPFRCSLALAIGAFTKYLSVYEKKRLIYFMGNSVRLCVWSLILWFISLVLIDLHVADLYTLLRLFASLATAFFLLRIIDKPKSNWIDLMMNNPVLLYIGKISYGIYVYHLIVMVLLDPLVSKIVYAFTSEKNLLRYNLYVITLPIYTLITIGIASLSFTFIESKISKIKNRIVY